MVLVLDSYLLSELVVRKKVEACFANSFQNNFIKQRTVEQGLLDSHLNSGFQLFWFCPFLCLLSLPISGPLDLQSLSTESDLYFCFLWIPEMPCFPLFHVHFYTNSARCLSTMNAYRAQKALESPPFFCWFVFFPFFQV